MAEDTTDPSVHLHLTPSADDAGNITSLRFKATLKGFSFGLGALLCSFGRQGVPGDHPSWYPYYLPDGILSSFSDSRGPLAVAFVDEDSRQVRLDRETQGDVAAEWEVPVLAEGDDNRGERLHVASTLHRDQCGVIGAGRYTRRAATAKGVDVLRPMDDIVRDLLVRRRDGGGDEKVRKKDWLAGVAYWLGQEDADRHFREMAENDGGRVNGLDDMLTSFGTKHGPHPVRQETLEFGFDRRSLETRSVGGTVERSRAWEAGLRDGDRIVWHSRPEACQVDFERKFRLAVERGGEKVDVEYWPRSWEKVTCWQILEGKYEPPTK